MKRLMLIAGILIIAVSGCGGGGGTTTNVISNKPPVMDPEGNYSIVAGTIRQNATDPTRWDYLDNEGHEPMGVLGAYATAEGPAITIKFDKTYRKVVTFVCGPDEWLATNYNMSVGASCGYSSALLRSSGVVGGANRVFDLGSEDLSRGNIWFYGVFEE